MTKRLNIHLLKQFDRDGIRKTHINKYELKEGTIRGGTAPEDVYRDRAKMLYIQDQVDRIILLARKTYQENLEKLAEEILEKSCNEWKRSPNEWLIIEDKHIFADSLEIIEKKGKGENVEIIQIDLASNIYSTAEYYLSRINKNPEELPMALVRILAGFYPQEWRENLPKDISPYDPKDVLQLLISMSSERILIAYLEFFHNFCIEKDWDVEKMLKNVEPLLEIPTTFHVGLEDLHLILRIIHTSLLSNSISKIISLKNEVDNYFLMIETPERYTDMLFKRYLELFDLLERFQEKDDFQDKLYFLEESRKIIRESENLVENKFVEPFKKFYLNILKRWMNITFEEGRKLLGKPLLEAKLQTKRAIWKEKLLPSLNIRNIGIGKASNIEVKLHNSPEYDVSGKDVQIIDALQRNREVDIDFQVKPLKKGSIDLLFSISYEDNIRLDISDTLFFVEKEEFRQVSNPYNFTRPAEENMFFGRKDLLQWIENNMKESTACQNIMILGQRRTGKTSFLRRVKRRIDSQSDSYCFFVDMEIYSTMDDIGFLHTICQKLNRRIPNDIPPPTLQEFVNKRYLAFGNYVESLLSNMSKGIILIFDEFDIVESMIKNGKFNPGFLLFLRGFFQDNPHIGAIISGNFDFEKLNSLEWQQFFTVFTPKEIEMLDEDSARDLVEKPVKDFLQYDQYAVKKILDFSGRNPFYIQLICYTLIDYINEKKRQNFVEVEDINISVLDEAKRNAEPTLILTWNELDTIDRNILFALSRLKSQYRRSIELKEIESYLKQNSIRIKRWRLYKLLETLVKKDILAKSGESPPFYDFSILLLGEWIVDNGSFTGE